MDHSILLSALREKTLTEAARAVLAYLYARTNGSLAATVSVAEICADLDMADSTLRRHRSALAAAGYLASERDGDDLAYELRAPSERPDPERAPSERAPSERYGAQRAPSARSDDASAHLVSVQRAPSERATSPERAPSARAERDDGTRARARIGISLNSQEGRIKPSSPDVGAPAPTTDPRTMNLLRAAGLVPKAALEAATGYTLEQIARHVAQWQLDLKSGKAANAGALHHRLTHPEDWPVPPPLGWDAMRAGILATRITDDEVRQWGITNPLDAYTVPAGYEGLIKS